MINFSPRILIHAWQVVYQNSKVAKLCLGVGKPLERIEMPLLIGVFMLWKNYRFNEFIKLLEIMRESKHCGKGAEAANKHSLVTLRYIHCGIEYDIFKRTVH